MKSILLFLFAVIIFVTGFLFGKNSGKEEVVQVPEEYVSDENYIPVLREISLDMNEDSFSLGEIRVRKGDTIKVTLNSISGVHNFVINEFSVKSPEIDEGSSEIVEFVADKVGTFEYYCGIENHRSLGMKGKLIIN